MLMLFIILLLASESAGCPENCEKCSDGGNAQQCERCSDGYWLTEGNFCPLCPSNCERCTNNNNCTECKPKFWDIRININCDAPCSETCTESGCDDITGHCYGCPPGVYGAYCGQNCDLCKDGQCELQRCRHGCKEGYFESTDNNFECKKCHDHCLSCLSWTNCKQCEIGYYKRFDAHGYNHCSLCHSSCKECVSYNECSACKPGRYGPTCSNDCDISNCKTCNEVNGVVKCTKCNNGYSLRNGNCILGTNVCSKYCITGCDVNGDCLDGCKDGWTGMKCTERCANQCTKCDQGNENICKICEGDFFKTTCSVPCSSHCITLSGLVTCDINNGTCLHGCDNGYWGNKCDKQCPDGCNSVFCNQSNGFCDTCARTHYGESCLKNCSKYCFDKGVLSAICNKTNGKCLNGCEDRYSGDTCQLSVIKTTTSKTGNDHTDQDDSFARPFLLGTLNGVGICMLFVAAFIAIRRIRRMRQKSSSSKSVMEAREYENTAVTMHVVSSDETGNTTSVEAVGSLYERLEGDTRDDQHHYSGLERRTDQHGSRFANIK